MNHADAKTFIRQRIVDEVQNAYPAGLLVQLDNAPDIDHQNRQYWARASIKLADSFKVSTGTPNRFRRPGAILWNVFTKPEKGDRLSDDISDFITAVFENTKVNDVTYRTVSAPTNSGMSQGWYQVNVSCPFYYDHLA